MSPLWPYHVTTQVQLDAATPVLLNLADPSMPGQGGGEETVQSAVVWSATGLANARHKLLISVGPGEPFAIVDTIMCVVFDPHFKSLSWTCLATRHAMTSITPHQMCQQFSRV